MKTLTSNPYAALKHKQFVFLISGIMINTAALLIQEVLLGYELYKITHNPLSLGIIGLAEALPYMSIALFGGHLADNRDKKTILQIGLFMIILCSILLTWVMQPAQIQAFGKNNLLIIIYGLIAIIGFAKGIYYPAGSSLKAFLVPREIYSNAASWASTFWQTGAVLGPGLAGFLYAYYGLSTSLIITIFMLAINFLLITQISKQPILNSRNTTTNIWQSIKEGFQFVFSSKILFYSISLDLVAVLFGGVVAILPIFAEDILHVGAKGLGILRAAPSVGAIITILATAFYPPKNKAWRNMIIAVTGFGLSTFVFAISKNFYLSVFMLLLTGAFDSISVVIRQTILQLVPPENMRGRVISVNSLFVSSSNEIGAFESGLAASMFGTVPSVMLGAGFTLFIIAIVFSKSKELLKLNLNDK